MAFICLYVFSCLSPTPPPEAQLLTYPLCGLAASNYVFCSVFTRCLHGPQSIKGPLPALSVWAKTQWITQEEEANHQSSFSKQTNVHTVSCWHHTEDQGQIPSQPLEFNALAAEVMRHVMRIHHHNISFYSRAATALVQRKGPHNFLKQFLE